MNISAVSDVGDPVRPVFAVKAGARGDISLKPGETSNAAIAWSVTGRVARGDAETLRGFCLLIPPRLCVSAGDRFRYCVVEDLLHDPAHALEVVDDENFLFGHVFAF